MRNVAGLNRLSERRTENPADGVPGVDAGGPRGERGTRIELALSAWEADVLPLNYTRDAPLTCVFLVAGDRPVVDRAALNRLHDAPPRPVTRPPRRPLDRGRPVPGRAPGW